MFGLLSRMVYNRLATATMRNQMTQAETYTPTPDSTNDYTYTSDAVGNVQVIYRASGSTGQEAYFFAQDAFENELSGDANIPAPNRTNLLGGATWASARTAGITEHQTGKIQSAFSGLYYFHARFYDPVVGRFVGRDPEREIGGKIYSFTDGNPINTIDPTGSFIQIPSPDPGYPVPPVPSPIINGCTPDEEKEIQNAVSILWYRLFGDCGSQMDPEKRACVIRSIDKIEIRCNTWCCTIGDILGYDPDGCEAGFGNNSITLCPNLFGSGRSVAYVILHEVLHICGCHHSDAGDPCGCGKGEDTCTGDQTKPCFPDCGIDYP